jgi:hypothetical protein
MSETPVHNPAFDGGVNVSEDSRIRLLPYSSTIYRKNFNMVIEFGACAEYQPLEIERYLS